MDELRDRIAQAIAGADSGTLHGVRPCAACQTGDTNQPCDDCLTMADAVIKALGTRVNGRDLQMLAEGWDECVESLRYEDGSPVEIVSDSNPYRKVLDAKEAEQ